MKVSAEKLMDNLDALNAALAETAGLDPDEIYDDLSSQIKRLGVEDGLAAAMDIDSLAYEEDFDEEAADAHAKPESLDKVRVILF